MGTTVSLNIIINYEQCCQVAAGLGHCLGVTQKGDVVAWGWAAAGQLGLGHSYQGSHTVVHPTQVSMLNAPLC